MPVSLSECDAQRFVRDNLAHGRRPPSPMPRPGGQRKGPRRTMAEWVIQRLTSVHDRAAFSCGKAPLDTFLVALVSQCEKRRQALRQSRPFTASKAIFCGLGLYLF
jgi:hypothetical protein